MVGQTNLLRVLKSLTVLCDNVEYGFATIKDKPATIDNQILGTFREAEGITIIATKEYLKRNKIEYQGPYAKLTIKAHTSLDLVGLTAVLATKLAEEKISANVVAAYFHDHIFVQFELCQKSIEILDNLRNNQTLAQ
jgi:uncharacterized protein